VKTRRQVVWPAFALFTVTVLVLFAMSGKALGQQTPAPTNAVVPNLVNFSGLLTDANGKPLTGVISVTFSLYKDRQVGAAIWIESQNVQVDKTGHYSVMLGSTTSQGLPADLFSSGEARWLSVQVEGQPEEWVMLLSVPYAMKAADAATIGGLPPSAFALASQRVAASPAPASPSSTIMATNLGGSGTQDFIPLWTSSTGNLGNSVLFQSGSGSTAKIGINTTAPISTLDIAGGSTVRGLLSLPATGTASAAGGHNSQPLNFAASVFNGGTSTPVTQTFQWQAEPLNNDKSTAGTSLNLRFGSGTSAPAETGLHIANNGQITFAAGQKFPGTGTGNGTLTGVTAGPGLAGGGTTGNVTLSVSSAGITNAMLQHPGLTVNVGTGLVGGGSVPLGGATALGVDTTQVPLLNAGTNTFNGNQNINGNVAITNNASFVPLTVQSSATFGTWLELNNTSSGGKTWAILSAGGANSEGAGSLGITNFSGNSNIFLEGHVHANTLSVNNDIAMSSNPHMTFSGYLIGNLGNFPIGGLFIPDRNITITRATIAETNPGSACLTTARAQVISDSVFPAATLVDVDLGNSQIFADSGQISVSVSAGTQLFIQGIAASGCDVFGGSPSNVMVNVQYVMQ
jgi:hypothetical protein